jgi:SAM-dependent methyltransferase
MKNVELSYKGIKIMAVPGLHPRVFQKIYEFGNLKDTTKKLNILDWGCGEGAFTKRLLDNGYSVTSVDVSKDNFFVENSNFIQLNFNNNHELSAFVQSNNEKFDVVVGMEVIEHIENPWEYIRQLKSMLKPGGLIIITTPNITSWHSRLRFLIYGNYDDFTPLSQFEHINPITPWEMNLIFTRIGLNQIKFDYAGKFYGAYGKKKFHQIIIQFFALLIRPFQNGILRGYCYIATAIK